MVFYVPFSFIFFSLFFLPSSDFSYLLPTILGTFPIKAWEKIMAHILGVSHPHTLSSSSNFCHLYWPCLTWYFHRTIQFYGIRPSASSDSFCKSDLSWLEPAPNRLRLFPHNCPPSHPFPLRFLRKKGGLRYFRDTRSAPVHPRVF